MILKKKKLSVYQIFYKTYGIWKIFDIEIKNFLTFIKLYSLHFSKLPKQSILILSNKRIYIQQMKLYIQM